MKPLLHLVVVAIAALGTASAQEKKPKAEPQPPEGGLYEKDIEFCRFGAVGFSAGAHLSMLLGTMDKQDGLEGEGGNSGESSKVQAVVSYFGPTDLSQEDFPPNVNVMIYDFLGGPPKEKAEAFKAAS